ncbi:MAG: hypothetical protein ACPG8W_00790 [Candidatus Promineifilaceae bacterium]
MTNLSRKQRRLDRALTYWEDMAGEISAEKLHTLNDQRTQLYKTLTSGLQDAVFVERSAELLTNLYPLGERGGYLKEWIPLMQSARTKLDPESHLICQLLNQLAYSLFREERLDDASAMLDLTKEHPSNKFQRCLTQFYYAIILVKRKQFHEAIKGLKLSIAAFQDLGEIAQQKLGSACLACASAYRVHGSYQEALESCQQAIAAYARAQDVSYEARSYQALATIYSDIEQFEQGLEALDKAEHLLTKTISKLDETDLLIHRGVIYCRQKDWASAIGSFKKIDTAFLEENNNPHLLGYYNYNLAFALDGMHKHAEAIALMQRSQQYWGLLNDAAMLALTQSRIAESTIFNGDIAMGLVLWATAVEQLEQVAQTDYIVQRRAEIDRLDTDWYRKHKCDWQI